MKNINDIGDVRKIFDGLLSYKKEESVCTKVRKSIYNTNSFEGVVFNDKNPIINSFINHKVKLSSSKNNNVGFYGCNMSIMKMEEEIKEIQDEIKEIQDEIKLLENELSSKIRINNKKIIDTTLAINKLVDLLEYNDLSKINVDILIAKEEEFNNEVIIVSRLNLMEKIDGVDKLKELKSSLEKIKCIKNKYFIFVESVNGRQISLLRSLDNKLKKYTAGINSKIPKENILLDINKIASVLFINNNDRENYNGFF